jgi:hypothetical protein
MLGMVVVVVVVGDDVPGEKRPRIYDRTRFRRWKLDKKDAKGLNRNMERIVLSERTDWVDTRRQ